MYDKAALIDLVRRLALQVGQFKLASGKLSSYYLDCRKVTLDSAGANLIADGMLELMGDIRNYEMPEKLPNGDIIIRRKPDLPAPPKEGEVEL